MKDSSINNLRDKYNRDVLVETRQMYYDSANDYIGIYDLFGVAIMEVNL